MNKHQKITLGGFTLIELLIVISLIGIIVGAIQLVLNPVEQVKKGRDAQRKHSLDLFVSPLEEYLSDKGRYPISTLGDKLPLDFSPYMQTIPEDPINTQTYAYQTNSSGSYYRLYAKLERCSNDSQTIPGVNCSTDPYNYCRSSSNIGCSLFAVIPTPTPTSTPIPTPTPSPTPTVTPTPMPIGCADGSTERDFGNLPGGERVHGCNGSVPYASLGSLCASGWHVGDVGPGGDIGLGNFLTNNPSENNFTRRTLYINGSGTTRQGYRSIGTGVEECWGALAPCTILDQRNDFMLTHTEFLGATQRPTYFNGGLAMPNHGFGVVQTFVVGAICVSAGPPPSVWVACGDGIHYGQTAPSPGNTCTNVCASFGKTCQQKKAQADFSA
mgnify:FL=1